MSVDGVILMHDCWWDMQPMPAEGPMKLLAEIRGVILNRTHIGTREKDHWNLTK